MARYYPGPKGSLGLPGSDEDAVRLAERYPDRFFPLIGMQRPLLTGSRTRRASGGRRILCRAGINV